MIAKSVRNTRLVLGDKYGAILSRTVHISAHGCWRSWPYVSRERCISVKWVSVGYGRSHSTPKREAGLSQLDRSLWLRHERGPWTLSSVSLATLTHSRHRNGTHMVNNRAVEIRPSDHWHVCLYTSISFKRAQCVLMLSLESEVRNFVQLSLYHDVYKYEHTADFLCDHISTLIAAWQEVVIHSS